MEEKFKPPNLFYNVSSTAVLLHWSKEPKIQAVIFS